MDNRGWSLSVIFFLSIYDPLCLCESLRLSHIHTCTKSVLAKRKLMVVIQNSPLFFLHAKQMMNELKAREIIFQSLL